MGSPLDLGFLMPGPCQPFTTGLWAFWDRGHSSYHPGSQNKTLKRRCVLHSGNQTSQKRTLMSSGAVNFWMPCGDPPGLCVGPARVCSGLPGAGSEEPAPGSPGRRFMADSKPHAAIRGPARAGRVRRRTRGAARRPRPPHGDGRAQEGQNFLPRKDRSSDSAEETNPDPKKAPKKGKHAKKKKNEEEEATK